MKVVLDSNVLVSATISPDGLAGRIFQAWRRRAYQLCSSAVILGEVDKVLARDYLRDRYQLRDDDVRLVIDEVTSGATFPYREVEAIAVVRDLKDNMVLECAIGCEADLVVTNDEDLLALKAHAGVGIVSLRDFLRTLGD